MLRAAILVLCLSYVSSKTLFFHPQHSQQNYTITDDVNGLCPDRRTTCSNSATCCVMSNGYYACCPLVSATCCSDHIHCCPYGYYCYTNPTRCLRGDVTQEIPQKSPERLITKFFCKDKETSCPNGCTCCPAVGGGYGCCPRKNAVCCNDNIHCCPQGYVCDTRLQHCERGNHIVAWLTKITEP